MAERIAIGRLHVGHGDSRRVIDPGTSFRTESVGISDAELKVLDAHVPPVVRRPAPTPRRVADDPPVRAEIAELEAEVKKPADEPAVEEGQETGVPRGRRRAKSDLDDL
jgi:hypothetical protein